jgi:hypothetical protein
MNPILKASIAAAMTLGAVSAHAAFAVPSSSSPGDLILFADVVNSSGVVVGSYAGDTGITVLGTQAAISANQTASMNDGTTNLASLLALDTGTNKLVWSIQGGGQLSGADFELGDAGAAQFVTTAANNNTAQMAGRPSSALDSWNGITPTAVQLNKNSGNASSVFGTATASAGVFDSTTVASNPANWYLLGGATGVSGLGTAWNLYGVTGVTNPNNGNSGPIALSLLGTATLSANGVTFGAATSGTPVPLPAAIWLLGSGLLGLAGVGRRKAVAPTAV